MTHVSTLLSAMAVTIIAILLVMPSLTLAQTQEPFAAGSATATCVISTDSPGTVFKLAIPDAVSYAGIDYTCPGCTAAAGAAPATPPSFSFKSDVASLSSGGSPRLVMLFEDGTGNHKMELRPLTWAGGVWEFVDGAGNNWDNNGGTCGFLYATDYATAIACHSAQALTATFIVTDSGFLTAPYTHFIDDVTIGSTTFSDCSIDAALDDFRDKRRGSEINVGPDLREGPPPVPHFTAINFTGTVGAADDTWVTVYDPTPGVPLPPTILTGSVSLSADVLIAKQNNAKGAGLLALYNQPPSLTAKGLALILIENGNTDRLVLATVTGTPTPAPASAPTTLMTKTLAPGQVAINKWYRVTMDVVVTGGSFSVTGKVFSHADPLNPNSALGPQVGGTLVFPSTTLASKGLTASGEVGIVAAAKSATVNSSVTNFVINP